MHRRGILNRWVLKIDGKNTLEFDRTFVFVIQKSFYHDLSRDEIQINTEYFFILINGRKCSMWSWFLFGGTRIDLYRHGIGGVTFRWCYTIDRKYDQLRVVLPECKLPTTLKLLFQLPLSYIYTVLQGVPHEHRHHRFQRQHWRHGRPSSEHMRPVANSAAAQPRQSARPAELRGAAVCL